MDERKMSPLTMFKPSLLGRTMIVLSSWITSVIAFYALTFNATNLAGDIFINFILSTIAGSRKEHIKGTKIIKESFEFRPNSSNLHLPAFGQDWKKNVNFNCFGSLWSNLCGNGLCSQISIICDFGTHFKWNRNNIFKLLWIILGFVSGGQV